MGAGQYLTCQGCLLNWDWTSGRWRQMQSPCNWTQSIDLHLPRCDMHGNFPRLCGFMRLGPFVSSRAQGTLHQYEFACCIVTCCVYVQYEFACCIVTCCVHVHESAWLITVRI